MVILLLVISLLPVVLGAFFAHPVSDDYSFSYLTVRAVQNGEGLTGVLRAATQEVKDIYYSWQGTYAAIFLFSLQPGIYGIRFYWITTAAILLSVSIGTFCLLDSLLKSQVPCHHSTALLLSCGILFVQIQFVPSVPEGLYWYNGAVYYSFFYGIFLLFLSIMVKLFRPDERKRSEAPGVCGRSDRKNDTVKIGAAFYARVIILMLLALFISGGNYSTALLGAEILVIILLWQIFIRADRHDLIALMGILICWLSGIVVSGLAPGNEARGGLVHGMTAAEAIQAALMQGEHYLSDWIRLPQIAVLILALPAVIPLSSEIKYMLERHLRRRWTRIFWILIAAVASYGLFASQMVPSFYALSGPGAGRQINVYYYSCIWLMMSFELEFFVMARLLFEDLVTRGRKGTKSVRLIHYGRTLLVTASIFAVLCIAGLRQKGIGATASGQVAKEYISGSLQTYQTEWKQIDQKLEQAVQNGDETVKLPVVPATPACYESFDLMPDNPDYWGNRSLARYYGLGTVIFAVK